MLKRIGENARNAIANWGLPLLLGLGTMAVIWAVWYFTKAPCLMAKADAGMCNPGVLASFINADILTKSGAGGLAVGALKGGYDRYMLNKMLKQEQEARQQAEAQLAIERKRADAAYDMVTEIVTEFRTEFREARRRDEEEHRQYMEERRQSAAFQQAMLDTLVQLAQQRNGGGGPSAANATVTPDGS